MSTQKSTTSTADTVEITLGDHAVQIPRGGLYDTYQMATDLDAVARDPRVAGVDFFRPLPKTRAESSLGPTMTPNFYYAMSRAQLIWLAPTTALRKRLPDELTPLQVAPGVGVFSAIFFRYDVCDIDFYTEASVGIAVRPARNGGLGSNTADLISSLADDHLHAYVLSLPVNTDIAQIRGHDAYGFPKWVTDLDVRIDDTRAIARVTNDNGGLDVALDVATPRQQRHASGRKVSTLTSYTQHQGGWHQTFNQTNVLATGTRRFPRETGLTLGEGRLSDDIRSLRPIRPLRLEVTTSAQAALHLPVPTSIA